MKKTIAVIGAGIAGVTVARSLSGVAEVALFEKSRGLGGRMAHRRAPPFAFDHGAQYFTARGEAFRLVVAEATSAGAVAPWPADIASLPAARQEQTGRAEPRYVGTPAMNSLARHLAGDIKVALGIEIRALQGGSSGWRLLDTTGVLHGPYDLVVASAPAPQTAALLPPEFSGHERLASARISGCFTLMVGLSSAEPLPFMAARTEHPVLSWISADSSKPSRHAPPSLVVHSRNDWADAHFEADRGWVTKEMSRAVTELTGLDVSNAPWTDLHRWRYANVDRPIGTPHLFDPKTGLAACGDWCIGNRVEAAFESGRSLGEAVKEWVAEG